MIPRRSAAGSMSIDLVFPPFDFSVLMPEIGIPVLTATLKREGFTVRQADFNVDFVHTYLQSLRSLVPLIERFEKTNVHERESLGSSTSALLDHLAGQLARLAGRREPPPDVLAAMRRLEIPTGKYCHLNERLAPPDWREELETLSRENAIGGPEAAAILELMVRHGESNARFRRDLLRLIHHYHFTPQSFGLEHVLEAAARPNPLLDPFYSGRLEAMFAEREPKIFGIAIWSTPQLIPALALAARVRKMLGKVTIVAGGAWCTYGRSHLAALPELYDFVDAFAVHECDQAVARLARAVQRNEKPGAIPNILARETARRGSFSVAPPTPFEDIALPRYDGLPVPSYPVGKLALRLFRGCYWARCSFCSHSCHPYTRRYSFRKNASLSAAYLGRVAAHVRDMKRLHGIRDFTLSDNLVSPGIMQQLCDLNVDLGLGITWDSLARFEREYTLDFCRRLAAGGCTRLDLGLETSSDAALKRLKKGITKKLVVRCLRNLAAAGVGTRVIVLHYPGQRVKEFEDTLRFLADHRDIITEVAVSRFYLSLGTLPHALSGDLGIRPSRSGRIDLDVFNLPYRAARELSLDEMIEITNRILPDYW